MNSHTTRRFRELCAILPPEVKKQAVSAFNRFAKDPNHPGLRLKQAGAKGAAYSIRVSLNYRAVGILEGDTIVWFWIGKHEEYERLLKSL